jgi:hypothetical protein
LPKDVLLEQEKALDDEINEEVDKVKMTSDFVSTLKKLDAQPFDIDPGQMVPDHSRVDGLDYNDQDV